MGTVIVFAENGNECDLGALPIFGEKMEIVPLDGDAVVAASGDVELAIIECGANANGGLRLLREIKQMRPDVPVIFVTDASSEEVVLRAFRSGAREFFKKPLDLAEFRQAVEEILRFKRDIPGKRSKAEGKDTPSIFRVPRDVPERVMRAISYIEQNLPTPLYLDDLARQACLSKYHFCRLFKKYVGVSPIQYMLALRISRAKFLLRRPEFTISSVAIRSGFNDLSEFNKQFRKLTGTTPSAYRKSA